MLPDFPTREDWTRELKEQLRLLARRGVAWARAQARRLTPLMRDRRARGAAAVLAAGFLIVAIDVLVFTPSVRDLRGSGNLPVATVVLDHQDQPAFTIFDERRFVIPLADMSPHLIAATLAVEDQRFYEHGGLDVWRIGGAALANLREGGWVEGGSTITQQVARLSFLTPEKSIRRKVKEAYLALRIEWVYDKDEILGVYLNKVYFGAGLYGAEAAARGYFGKPAAELTLTEAALLAGLIQAPSAYAPTSHPERALARRAVVFHRLADAGLIGSDEIETLAAEPLELAPDKAGDAAGAYFKHAVMQELVDRFGVDAVSRGGLRVYSTVDLGVQRAAEQALADGLDRVERRRGFKHPTRATLDAPADGEAPTYLQGAVVALDPQTGAIRALVGGRDFAESQFNRATQARRQSGSAFKPLVYAAALEQGYSPATLVTGLDTPIPTPEGPWLPADDHANDIAMTMRTALRTSSNRAAAQVIQAVGVQRAAEYAARLGVSAPPVPSMVLGSGDVTPLALTNAYAAFANGGWLHTPYLIRRVEDADGATLFEAEPVRHRVVSEATAFQVAQMLADVINRGTGWRAREAGFRKPAAGKTGTTNDYRDAWFVGFTPQLATGVWVGFDEPTPIMPNGYAGDLAAPIWGRFMADATAGHRDAWLDRPRDVIGVEVCTASGLLPGSGCRRVSRVDDDGEASERSLVGVEYFRRGTEPSVECPLHRHNWFFGPSTRPFQPSDFHGLSVIGPVASGRPWGESPLH